MRLATTTGEFEHYVGFVPAKSIRAYEDTGFKCIDLNFFGAISNKTYMTQDDWKSYICEAGEAAEDLGFCFVQAHSPAGSMFGKPESAQLFLETTRRSIEACAMLKIPQIVVHPVFFGEMEGGKDGLLELNRRLYAEIVPMLEEYGVTGLIENTSPLFNEKKFAFPCSGADMLELLEVIASKSVHCLWDTGHGNMHGCDQYREIKTIGSELYGLHIQDNFGVQDSHLTPFNGVCNFDEVMTALLEIGYKGEFTFECGHLVRLPGSWPHLRKPFTIDGVEQPEKARTPSLELQRKAVAFMYEIGKFILTQYDCFEE